MHQTLEPSLHPILEAALAQIAEAPAIIRRAQYVSALRAHDWDFEFADTQHYYEKGRDQRARLMLEAAAIDPDFELWNKACSAQYRRGGA